jgi:hypothetical protein
VLIVSDPDTAKGAFVHVTRYNLSPRGDGAVNEGGVEGRESSGKIGWAPPVPAPTTTCGPSSRCAPRGLAAGADPDAVIKAVGDGALASGAITATYSRSGSEDPTARHLRQHRHLTDRVVRRDMAPPRTRAADVGQARADRRRLRRA